MPKRKRTNDPNVVAHRTMLAVTEKHDPDAAEVTPAAKPKKKRKNPYAVALGRKGGKVGGKRRAENMTPKERSEAARLAAQARWKTEDKR